MKNYPNIFWNRIHEEQESIFRSIKLKSNLNIVLQVSIPTDQTYILNMTQITQHRFKIINFPCTKLTTTPAKRIQRSTQCFSISLLYSIPSSNDPRKNPHPNLNIVVLFTLPENN